MNRIRPASLDSLSQWQLVRLRFGSHKLAVVAFAILCQLYAIAGLCEFVAPVTREWRDLDHAYAPPQPIHFSLTRGCFVYPLVQQTDPETLRKSYWEDRSRTIPIGLFVKGEPYRLWGVLPTDRHLFGISRDAKIDSGEARPTFYLLGADKYGRDVFSRVIHGSRISLSVGFISIAIMFLIGTVLGGLSGYLGGLIDTLVQRIIEIINSFPALPLWLALAAAMPGDWSPLTVYFAITVVLSLLGWTNLARTVRGRILSLREEDYITAARLCGAGHGRILFGHLLPGFTSHIIVALTLSLPATILGETSLSFLGLGLRAPIVSWGVMLQDCMDIKVIRYYPWLLSPVLFLVTAVLCFNFVGDGLRDAADPYGKRH